MPRKSSSLTHSYKGFKSPAQAFDLDPVPSFVWVNLFLAFEAPIRVDGMTDDDFRKALRGGSREALDRMFDQARSNCMTTGNAVRPVVFEGVFIAAAFSHEKRLANIARGIEELRIEMKGWAVV